MACLPSVRLSHRNYSIDTVIQEVFPKRGCSIGGYYVVGLFIGGNSIRGYSVGGCSIEGYSIGGLTVSTAQVVHYTRYLGT